MTFTSFNDPSPSIIDMATFLIARGIVNGKVKPSGPNEIKTVTINNVAPNDSFAHAEIFLTGFRYDYGPGKDHHVSHSGIRLKMISWDEADGDLVYEVSLRFVDKNNDDNYDFSYNYTILALGPKGARNPIDELFTKIGEIEEQKAELERRIVIIERKLK